MCIRDSRTDSDFYRNIESLIFSSTVVGCSLTVRLLATLFVLLCLLLAS